MQEASTFVEDPLQTTLNLTSESQFTAGRALGILDSQSEFFNSFEYESDNSELVTTLSHSRERSSLNALYDMPGSSGATTNELMGLIHKIPSKPDHYRLLHQLDVVMSQADVNMSNSFPDFFEATAGDLHSILDNGQPLFDTSHLVGSTSLESHHDHNPYPNTDNQMLCDSGNFGEVIGDEGPTFSDHFDADFDTGHLSHKGWAISEHQADDQQDLRMISKSLDLGTEDIEGDLHFYSLDNKMFAAGPHAIVDEFAYNLDNNHFGFAQQAAKATGVMVDKVMPESFRTIPTDTKGSKAELLDCDMQSSSRSSSEAGMSQYDRNQIMNDPRKRFIKSRIYKWSNNELEPLETLNHLELEIKGLDPLKVSNSVKRTIEKELRLQDQYLAAVMQGRRTLHLMKPRRRRNPTCDDLRWIPVSLYQAAYTNIKIHPLEKTDYSNEIPAALCFGKVNMRVKRAWLRGPNKQKLLMMLPNSQQLGNDDLDLEQLDDGECMDYFLFRM